MPSSAPAWCSAIISGNWACACSQAASGRTIAAKRSGLRPGDLLLFATRGRTIDHVAIYVGKNRIIHSSASGGGVRYDNLTSKRGKWLISHHVASRRVLKDGARVVAELASPGKIRATIDPN